MAEMISVIPGVLISMKTAKTIPDVRKVFLMSLNIIVYSMCTLCEFKLHAIYIKSSIALNGHFHNYDWLCHLAAFINNDATKGDQATRPVMNTYAYCMYFRQGWSYIAASFWPCDLLS